MALVIPSFVSTNGIELTDAILAPQFISYDTQHNYLNFDISVWKDAEAYHDGLHPVESNINYGTLTFTYTGAENLLEVIDDGLLSKIRAVEGKTQAECDEHNSTLMLDDTGAAWFEYWDITFQRFANAEMIETPINRFAEYEIE